MLLDMKLSKISLSPMSQSVTSTKLSLCGPAISEQSLQSLKEMAGSEPTLSLCHPAEDAKNFKLSSAHFVSGLLV